MAGLLGAVPPAGFKIGATTRRMQEYLGLPGPLAGFMVADGLHGSGSTISLSGMIRPGVECELAVHLAQDLPAGPCTREQAMAAVGEVMPAIEIVENRYADVATFGAAHLVADRAYHGCTILGVPYTEWRSLDLRDILGRMTIDGAPAGEGRGLELLGDPMLALAWLAQSAEAGAFGGLKAGQVVMLGSVTLPVWLDGPARVEVQFAPMEPVVVELT